MTREINPRLFKDEGNCIDNRFLGTVMLNFIDDPMARLIYETNSNLIFEPKLPTPEVEVEYGQTLAEATLKGIEDAPAGAWVFKDADHVVTDQEVTDQTKFELIFQPADNKKYKSVTMCVPVKTVKKSEVVSANATDEMEIQEIEQLQSEAIDESSSARRIVVNAEKKAKTYGEILTSEDLTFTISDSEKEKLLPGDTVDSLGLTLKATTIVQEDILSGSTIEEDGTKRFVYLLDETLELDHVGLISTNMAELLVKGITELSYRECATKVSEMTGQTISAMGVWNVIQALGEKVYNEEATLTEEYKKGHVKGEKEVPVLFEEADGVYIKLQGKDRKKEKQDKAEIKIGIAYDGWRKTGPERYALENKVVVAGFSKAKEFQEYREAVIAQEFNLDEVSQRILNAEGASWIKKVKDKSTCFQLDPFHRNKAVKEKIHERTAREAVLELLREEEIEEVFRYLEIYRNSLSDDDEIQDVEELIRYYENNREGLLPYQSQGLDLPEPPEGLEYRNMGTMENHVWSVIAKRMKHGHRSWSRRGGNHLAKILAKKCSGKLYEVTERLRSPVFEEEKVEELYGEILMSAKAPKKEEKGYEYPVMGHVVGLDGKIQGERKRLLHMAGY